MSKRSIEHPLYNSNKGFTIMRVFVTSIPVLIGFIITVEWQQIVESTQCFADNLFEFYKYSIDWLTLLTWISFISWISLLGFYIYKEENQARKKMMYIIQNMHQIPNLAIIRNYPSQIEAISNILNPIELVNKIEEVEITNKMSELKDAINACLVIVCDITSNFSKIDNAKYIANIMGLFNVDKFLKLQPKLNHDLIFTGDTGFENYGNILVTLPGLGADNDSKTVSPYLIALPVTQEYKSKRGIIKPLPGAPTAIFVGNAFSKDTTTIKDECSHFDGDIRLEVESYFKKNSKDIKSFASFRLRDDKNAIGVLNIHSNKKYILGENDEYIETYLALISPILNYLEPFVKKYIFLYQYQLELLNLQKQRNYGSNTK